MVPTDPATSMSWRAVQRPCCPDGRPPIARAWSWMGDEAPVSRQGLLIRARSWWPSFAYLNESARCTWEDPVAPLWRGCEYSERTSRELRQ
jgi:hypothetical protein